MPRSVCLPLRSAWGKSKVAYEAGSSGFGIQRKLSKAGIECHVVAPSRVPRTGRQKTDAEDAMRLARFLRSGDLTSVCVPDSDVEGLRAVTHAREDALKAQQRLHQRWQRMTLRGKESNKVCIAIARELAGFI